MNEGHGLLPSLHQPFGSPSYISYSTSLGKTIITDITEISRFELLILALFTLHYNLMSAG